MKTWMLALALTFLGACGNGESGQPCGKKGGTCLSSCASVDSSDNSCGAGLSCCLPQE